MKWHMKNLLLAVLAISVVMIAVAPQAKEDPPAPAEMKKLSFPDFKEFSLDNGMEFLVVEHHEQPVVTMYFVVKTGDAVDPKGIGTVADNVSEHGRRLLA